jgi:hypothetical protein
MDTLSDVLTMLKPRSDMSGGFTAGGAWSIQFPRQQSNAAFSRTKNDSRGVRSAVDGDLYMESRRFDTVPGRRTERVRVRLAANAVLTVLGGWLFASAASGL